MARTRVGTYFWVLVVAVGTYAAVGALVDYFTSRGAFATWDDSDAARTWVLLVVGLGTAAIGAVQLRRRLASGATPASERVRRREPDPGRGPVPSPSPGPEPPPLAESPRGGGTPTAGQRIAEGIVTGSVVAVVSAVVTNLMSR